MIHAWSTRTTALLILAALVCALLSPMGAGTALGVISGVEVQVVPNVAHANARYTITFVPGEALAAGDAVLLQFPQGTTLPCSPCNPLVYADEVTVNDVHPAQPAYGNPGAAPTLRIFVPEAIPAGTTVAIVVSAVTPRVGNPDSGTYTIRVSTVQEAAVESKPYVIGTSEIMSPTVHLESLIAATPSGYTITFVTGVTGQLVQGSSIITITYAAGDMPKTPGAASMTVNGVIPDTVVTDVLKHTIVITSPVTVNAGAAVTIVIGAGYGLTNPAKAGNYVLYVHTSPEPGDVASEPFQINDLPMVSYSLALLPSWNVISVPFPTPVSLLPTCDLFLAWDGSLWQPVTTLVPGTGYLVRNTIGATTVTLTGLPSSSPQTQPATGTWQIIGNPYTTPASFACTSTVPYLLFWDGSLWQSASLTNLPPGLGFLLQASSPGTITLSRLP